MKAIRIFLLVLIIIGIGLLSTQKIWVPKLVDKILKHEEALPPTLNDPKACTMEAKICPDGTAVGRSGPHCEFEACPLPGPTPSAGMIKGSVTLSPICPMERTLPDPQCAPKGFETEVRAFTLKGNIPLKTVRSRNDGSFTLALPYGNYRIEAVGGNPLPRCAPFEVRLTTPTLNGVELSCDTGIR